jgi:hypothetical protein
MQSVAPIRSLTLGIRRCAARCLGEPLKLTLSQLEIVERLRSGLGAKNRQGQQPECR